MAIGHEYYIICLRSFLAWAGFCLPSPFGMYWESKTFFFFFNFVLFLCWKNFPHYPKWRKHTIYFFHAVCRPKRLHNYEGKINSCNIESIVTWFQSQVLILCPYFYHGAVVFDKIRSSSRTFLVLLVELFQKWWGKPFVCPVFMAVCPSLTCGPVYCMRAPTLLLDINLVKEKHKSIFFVAICRLKC